MEGKVVIEAWMYMIKGINKLEWGRVKEECMGNVRRMIYKQ